MKILGIITEYNPMHTGHIHHINEAKKKCNADYVICVMSGNFTQQGNPSLINKFTKASLAVENGVDLVIELPAVYALSSAENFCKAAITILHSLNCIDFICFGSECKTVDELIEIESNIRINKELIDSNIKKYLLEGLSYSNSRIKAITDAYNGKYNITEFFKSNNILGLEYIRTLKQLDSNIQVEIVHRSSDFNSVATDVKYMSATGIREAMQNNKLEEVKNFLPENIYSELSRSSKNIDLDNLYQLFRYKVITNEEIIKNIDEVIEGLDNRIYENCMKCLNYNDFINATCTRRYSKAKIKRIMIKVLLDIKKEGADMTIPSNKLYCRILAFNKKSNTLLSLLNKVSKIPVLTRLNTSVISNLSDDQKQLLNVDILATNVYDIMLNSSTGNDFYNKL